MELLKGRIVSTVSHELKQPLTVIQGLVELLRLSLTGKEGKYAEIINNEVQRMVQFITRFLDISRLESGREHIRKEPVDMVDILRQALPLFKALAAAKGIHMKVRMPDKTTAVMLDRDLTKQSIINLVENAIKYSPPGKDVMVGLTELTSGLRIDVIDNGYGMEEGELRKIFVKFYRGKTAIDNGSRGSGLGLAFVKEAVESQGGTISVRSVPGEGSTFSLVFPTG
jgi:signal transduction histidine kinase